MLNQTRRREILALCCLFGLAANVPVQAQPAPGEPGNPALTAPELSPSRVYPDYTPSPEMTEPLPSGVRPGTLPTDALTAPATPPASLSPETPSVTGPGQQPFDRPFTASPPATPSVLDSQQLNEPIPVTLFEERTLDETVELLNTVLEGKVVKTAEYPITLEIVLKLVEAQNLPIEASRLTKKLQDTLYYRTAADLLPDIYGTYNHSFFKGAALIIGDEPFNFTQTRIVPQINARWTTSPGGEDVFQALAARQRARSAKFLLDSTLQEQLTTATVEYYDLLAAGIQVENIKVGITESRSQVVLNEARVRTGVGTRLDLERARSQLTQREFELIQAENRLQQAQQQLLNRLNMEPEVALMTPTIAAQARMLVPIGMNTAELVARAVENNPELKAAYAEIKAFKNESRAVLSRVVPTVTLQAYRGSIGPNLEKQSQTEFRALGIETHLLDRLGLAIPLDYRARRLETKRREVERQQQLRNVQSEVVDAYLDSRAAAKSILNNQEQLEVAKEAYRLAVGRFRAGLGINVDVLNAQTALTIARVEIVNSIFRFNQAQARLLRSMGEASVPNLLNGLSGAASRRLPPKTQQPQQSQQPAQQAP